MAEELPAIDLQTRIDQDSSLRALQSQDQIHNVHEPAHNMFLLLALDKFHQC